jgi:hypothetical protein
VAGCGRVAPEAVQCRPCDRDEDDRVSLGSGGSEGVPMAPSPVSLLFPPSSSLGSLSLGLGVQRVATRWWRGVESSGARVIGDRPL